MPSEARPGESALDARLVGLERGDDPGSLRFVLTPHLCRPDGALFGGTALAASLAAMELVSGRPSLWSTVQFVGSARVGEVLECRVDVVARGNYIDQVQVRATADGRLVFSALGSTATPRESGVSGLGLVTPRVAPPDESIERPSRSWGNDGEIGHHRVSEFRDAVRLDRAPPPPGTVMMWARLLDEPTTTAAKLGFLADMVPVAICRGAGVLGAGTSLDNSLRVGHLVDTKWVLLELQGHVAHEGYGHGDVRMWSPDGVLMATGSQTAKLFTFDALFLGRRDG